MLNPHPTSLSTKSLYKSTLSLSFYNINNIPPPSFPGFRIKGNRGEEPQKRDATNSCAAATALWP